MTSKPVSQYLSRHAEPEALCADALAGSFGHVLVIPAYGEGQSLFDALGSVPRGPKGDTLIVVVLNARQGSPAAVHEANDAVRRRLSEAASRVVELPGPHPAAALAYDNGTVLLVDRARPGHFLPERQGVGLARKIGNDLALRLHAAGRVGAAWIHNTDADVILPNDYFAQTARVPEGGAAAIYFFEHRFPADETLAQAGRLYEISLRYYTLGLAWAESPFAFEAMGSCIAVRPEAYAAVRGFPKKNAAEDFYILDKLAKVGAIARLAGTPVHLSGRVSDRVPFGTGKALSTMVSKPRTVPGFRLYHPAVFAHLAAWLRVLEAAAKTGGRLDVALEELPQGTPFFQTQLLIDSLERMGAFPAIREAIGRSGDEATMRRHFHTWFDAFRTLKLIHALRDGGFPLLHWREALGEAPFTGLSASTVEDAEPLRMLLAVEERKLAGSPAGLSA